MAPDPAGCWENLAYKSLAQNQVSKTCVSVRMEPSLALSVSLSSLGAGLELPQGTERPLQEEVHVGCHNQTQGVLLQPLLRAYILAQDGRWKLSGLHSCPGP